MTTSEPPARSLFRKRATPDDLNRLHVGTAAQQLGIEFVAVAADRLRARMPVDARTRQPAGILHGGASVTLAETLGSVAAWLCLEPGLSSVGLDINANHVRAVRDGWVYGECRAAHVGRTTQVWHIDIHDEDGRLVCTSRITMAIVPERAA